MATLYELHLDLEVRHQNHPLPFDAVPASLLVNYNSLLANYAVAVVATTIESFVVVLV